MSNAKARHRRRRRAQEQERTLCRRLTETTRSAFITRMPGGPNARLQSYYVYAVRGDTAYAKGEVIDSGDCLRDVNVRVTLTV